MELGMIGLGRMGTNMVQRVLRAAHHRVVHDLHSEAVEAIVQNGAVGAVSLEEVTKKVRSPRSVWMMAPPALVDPAFKALIPLLERDELFARLTSRDEDDSVDKPLSALRFQFGGHQKETAVQKECA